MPDMTTSEINVYANRVACASRSELIVIMYEVTKNYILSAVEALKNGDETSFKNNLKKAKQFINELNTSLNMEYKISYDLMSLYMFMNRTLVNAIFKKDDKDLMSVVDMLDKLREAFTVVSSQDTSGPVMQNVQTVYAGLTYSKGNLNETYDLQNNRGYTV